MPNDKKPAKKKKEPAVFISRSGKPLGHLEYKDGKKETGKYKKTVSPMPKKVEHPVWDANPYRAGHKP